MAELKPCPFCGGKVSIVLCDDEGNLHDEAYRERPYMPRTLRRRCMRSSRKLRMCSRHNVCTDAVAAR